jgi:hypothetical protein
MNRKGGDSGLLEIRHSDRSNSMRAAFRLGTIQAGTFKIIRAGAGCGSEAPPRSRRSSVTPTLSRENKPSNHKSVLLGPAGKDRENVEAKVVAPYCRP